MGESILTRRVSKEGVGAELLADIEITGSAVTQVDISGLNITSDDEILLVSEIVNDSGSSRQYDIYINGNTVATNYYNQLLFSTGTTIGASRSNNAKILSVATGSKSVLNTRIKLTQGGYVAIQSHGVREVGGSNVAMYNEYITTTFTVSSITSIKISGATNAIGIGSRFTLYKLGGAS